MKIKVRNQIPTGYKKPTAAFTPTEAPPSPTSNPPSLGEVSDDDLVPLPPTPRHMRRKQVIDDDSDKAEQVQVFVRMRPGDVNPVAAGASVNLPKKHHLYDINKPTNTISLSANHPLVEKRSAGTPTRHSKNSEFTYDSLLLPPARTCSLYDSHITKLIHSSMAGYNSTVFAYGQTGSGKTHTLTGTEDEPGIIPLAVEQVFEEIYDDPTREFLLRVRYLEIYNEKLRDLLGPATQNDELRIREENKGNTFVENLTEVLVTTPQEVLALKDQGDLNRHVGATDWNDRSSRSHCVFQIVVESSERQSKLTKNPVSRKSTLNLIDLAGSEKATTDTSRRLEGSNINKSLLALSTVISEIVKTPKPTHIPFRNSKLTYLLKPSLSGDARVGVVCTIADGMEHHNATLDTLKFARTIKKVKVQAKRGDILDGTKDALLQQHITQIKILQKEVAELESNKYEEIRHAIAEERAANDEKVLYQNDQIDQLKRDLEEARKLVLNSASIDSEDMSNRRQSHLTHGQSRRLSDMGLGVSAPGFNVPVSKRRVLSTGIPVSTDENGEQDSRLREKDEEIESLKSLLSEVRSEQADTSSRIQDLETQLTASGSGSAEKETELQGELAKTKSENDELNKQLSDSLEQLKKMLIQQKEQAENDLNNSQELDDLRSEFANLQSARQDDELRLSALESQNELLRDDLKSADERKSVAENELKEIEKERDDVVNRLGAAEASSIEMKGRLEELTKESEALKFEKEEMQNEKASLLAKIETHEKDLSDVRIQLQTMEEKHGDVVRERDAYKTQLDEAVAAVSSSREAQAAAEKERDEAHSDLSKAKQAQKDSEDALKTADKAKHVAEEERDSHKAEAAKALQSQRAAEEALSAAETSLKTAIDAQTAAENELSTHKNEHASVRTSLDTLQSTHDTLQSTHTDLQATHIQLKEEKDEEISRLRETHKDLQQSYDTLNEALNRYKDDMQKEFDEHKREVEVLVKDANKWKAESEESQKERERLSTELSSLSKESEERQKSDKQREKEHASLKAQIADLTAEKEEQQRNATSTNADHKRNVDEIEARHQESLSKVEQELASTASQLNAAREAQASAKKDLEAEMATLINNRAEEDVEFQERLGAAEKESSDARGMATKLTSSMVEKDNTIKELEARLEEYVERQSNQEASEGFGQVHMAKRMEEYVELQDRVTELNSVIQKQTTEISKLKARPLPLPQSSHPSQPTSRISSESGAGGSVRRLFDRASSPNLRAQSTPLTTKTDDKEIDELNDVVRLQRTTIADLRKDILSWRDNKDSSDKTSDLDENRVPTPMSSRPSSSIDRPSTPLHRGHSRTSSVATPSKSRPLDSLSRTNSVKDTPEPLPAYDGLKSNSSIRRGPRKTLEHEIKNLQSANLVERSKKGFDSPRSKFRPS